MAISHINSFFKHLSFTKASQAQAETLIKVTTGLNTCQSARGPNVARKSFQSGPHSSNLRIFGLIFDGNTIKIGKKLKQSGPRMSRQHFFGPPRN